MHLDFFYSLPGSLAAISLVGHLRILMKLPKP